MQFDFILWGLLSIFCGFLVKAVDHLEDERKSKSPAKYFAAIIYGLLIGLIITYSPFSLVFIAAFLAQFASSKVDNYSHLLGCLVAIICIILLWNGSLLVLMSNNLTLFIALLFFGIADELSEKLNVKSISDYIKYRPFLKFGSLVVSLFSSLNYFIGIISFDFGYELFIYISQNKKISKKATKR